MVVGPAPKAMRAEVPRVATAQPATAAVKSQMATPMSGWTGREVLVATWLAGVALLGGLRWATASNFRRRLWMARPTVDERLLAQVGAGGGRRAGAGNVSGDRGRGGAGVVRVVSAAVAVSGGIGCEVDGRGTEVRRAA